MDKTTKILLATIAAGLWMNAAASVVRPALADDSTTLRTLGRDLSAIAMGICANPKLC